MKTTIKKIITASLIFVLSTLSFISCAQENKTTLELLQGKDWEMRTSVNMSTQSKYTDKQVSYYLNGEFAVSNYFYLSDNIEKSFNKIKVGKNQNGKYIIEENAPDNIGVFEIIELNEEKLEIRYIKHEHTLVYKVKKELMTAE
jgi:hypothetical protein